MGDYETRTNTSIDPGSSKHWIELDGRGVCLRFIPCLSSKHRRWAVNSLASLSVLGRIEDKTMEEKMRIPLWIAVLIYLTCWPAAVFADPVLTAHNGDSLTLH